MKHACRGVSIVSSIATDACCYAARRMLLHVFGWQVQVRSFSPVSLGFFLFGKRFSPFLPRDRTLTLRRRSRGVENTGSTTRRDETDVSRSFLSIARTVTFRLRDTPLLFALSLSLSLSLPPSLSLSRNTLDRTIYIRLNRARSRDSLLQAVSFVPFTAI